MSTTKGLSTVNHIKIIKKETYSQTVWFILHALTITCALSWSNFVSKIFNSYSAKKSILYEFIYLIILTVVSVILHIKYGGRSEKPTDMENFIK